MSPGLSEKMYDEQIPGFKIIIFGAKALIENFVETGTKDHPSKLGKKAQSNQFSDAFSNEALAAMESAMMHEINQQCLEADARFSLDLDTMVLWTLYQCYGWREKRLHDFYLAMAREHRRMREYYQMDDLYPERYKLKEKGIDVEKWQEEVLRDDP